MAYFLASDKYRDLRDAPSGYRFARTYGRRFRARTALSRVNGYLNDMIEAIANSKIRRMERELELRGIRFDRSDNSSMVRHPDRAGVREDC